MTGVSAETIHIETHTHHRDTSPSPDPEALRENYLHWVFGEVCDVSLAGIDRKAVNKDAKTCLNLGSIYTVLLTQKPEFKGRAGSGQTLQGLSEEMFFDRQGRRLSALAQLNQHARLVLLGDPGSGKSTFVNFVTLCLAGAQLSRSLQTPETGMPDLRLLTAPLPDDEGKDEEERQPWQHGSLLPVRVILRDFAAEGLPAPDQKASVTHLWKFLSKTFQEAAGEDYVPYISAHLKQRGGLLLLDGLDEVPQADQRRPQIKQVVEDFVRRFPHCRIVVTSRTYAYQEQDWRLSGCMEAVLSPFSQGQVCRFVDRWYEHIATLRGMRPDVARGRAELLKRVILHNDRLYSLAQRPLLLTLMASLHAWRGGSLPEKREELYNDTVELLLDWWESDKVKGLDGHALSLTEALKLGREGWMDCAASSVPWRFMRMRLNLPKRKERRISRSRN